MRTIADAKVQLNYNCYNVYFYECLHNAMQSLEMVWRNRSIPTQFRTSESTHSVMKMTMEWP